MYTNICVYTVTSLRGNLSICWSTSFLFEEHEWDLVTRTSCWVIKRRIWFIPSPFPFGVREQWRSTWQTVGFFPTPLASGQQQSVCHMEKSIQPLGTPVYPLDTQGELSVIEGPEGHRSKLFRLWSRNPSLGFPESGQWQRLEYQQMQKYLVRDLWVQYLRSLSLLP